MFKLRTVRVVDALGVEFPEAELPQRIVGLKPGDPAAASEIRAAQTRIVDYFPQARAPAGQNPVGRAGRRSRAGRHGRDDHGRARPHRAVRRSDDQRAADLRSRDRALVSLYPSGRSLFASGDRRRAEHHPRNSGGRRRAHHRRHDARRLRPAALSDRCRGPPALRFRRVDEIFDDQWTRGPGLLGGPQRVRRRRAPAPAGRRLLCAALVHRLAKSHAFLVQRYRRARLGELSQTRLVGHDQRPPDRRAWRRSEHERRRLRRLSGRGRGRDGLASPPLQSEFLGPGWPRSAKRRRHGRVGHGQLHGWSAFPYPPISTRPTASSTRRAASGSTPPPWASARSSARASTWFR